MAKNRQRGEGSVFQRSSDNKWGASLTYIDPHTNKARRVTKWVNTKQQASEQLNKLKAELHLGNSLQESRDTFGHWLNVWVSRSLKSSSRKETTKELYANIVKTCLLPYFEQMPLNKITPSEIEVWLNVLNTTAQNGKPYSPSTIRQAFTLLGLVMEFAKREGLVNRNVVKQISRPLVPKKEMVWFNSEQIGALRKSATGTRHANLLDLVIYAGLRKGEALALRWTDIELDRKQIQINATLSVTKAKGIERTSTKTERARRVVPLVQEAITALQEQRKQQNIERLKAGEAWTPSDYVFTNEIGLPIDPHITLKWFKRLRKRAGIKEGTWHSLRHSAITALLLANVPLNVVSAIAGHSSISVTVDMYGHVSQNGLSDEMQRGLKGYGSASA